MYCKCEECVSSSRIYGNCVVYISCALKCAINILTFGCSYLVCDVCYLVYALTSTLIQRSQKIHGSSDPFLRRCDVI